MIHDVIYWFGMASMLCLVTGVLGAIWVFLVWPAVEAASITRMTFQIYKRRGITEHPTRLRMWWPDVRGRPIGRVGVERRRQVVHFRLIMQA